MGNTLYVVVERYEDSLIEILFKSHSEDEAKSFMKNRLYQACNKAGIDINEAYLRKQYGCYYSDINYHIQILEVEL